MPKIMIEVSDENHIKLLEIQLERKKNKLKGKEVAVNKIATELFAEKMNEIK